MKKETKPKGVEVESSMEKVVKSAKKTATNLKTKQDREMLKAASGTPKKVFKADEEIAPKPKKSQGQFVMKLLVNGKTYESKSDDLKEAILGLKPEKITSKAFFTLEFDGKSATLVSIIPRTKRIIGNEMTAYFFGRRIFQLLKPIQKDAKGTQV